MVGMRIENASCIAAVNSSRFQWMSFIIQEATMVTSMGTIFSPLSDRDQEFSKHIWLEKLLEGSTKSATLKRPAWQLD